MSWRVITEADVLSKISSAELEAIRAAALADGQTDPVTTEIDSVTELVRGYVASNPKNDLDTDNVTYIPERLIGPAVKILVVDIPSRVAGFALDENDVRRDAKKEAIRLLEQVAAGKFSITDPSTGTEGTESIRPYYLQGKSTRRFDRDSQEGL